MNKLLPISIVGPTSSGKTAVAVALSRILGGEIISADSRQIYKYLDIGTNKAGDWDKKRKVRIVEGIAQYGTDIIDPSDKYSAGEFVHLARKTVRSILRKKVHPIIVGGTGLYVAGLIDGLSSLPPRNEKIREKISQYSQDQLYKILKENDPEIADKNRSNPQRLIRSVELFMLTKKPVSQLYREMKREPFPCIQFGLKWERNELYKVIDKRSVVMIKQGMIEETERLLKKGYDRSVSGFQGLGYSAVIQYIEGTISREELLATLQQDTRNYAKRQITWFARDKRIIWVDAGPSVSPVKIARFISQQYRNLV